MFLVAAAVLAGGSVVAFGAAGGAQSSDPPIDLVSVGLPAPSDTADHRMPALSDDGTVVAFATTPATDELIDGDTETTTQMDAGR